METGERCPSRRCQCARAYALPCVWQQQLSSSSRRATGHRCTRSQTAGTKGRDRIDPRGGEHESAVPTLSTILGLAVS